LTYSISVDGTQIVLAAAKRKRGEHVLLLVIKVAGVFDNSAWKVT